MANILQFAEIFETRADDIITQEATSSWMQDNAANYIYNGGKTIHIPSLTTSGLGDYDRDLGYPVGQIKSQYEDFTLTQDRGVQFQIDVMDEDETNFLVQAGRVLAKLVRDNVIPETDAYRYSNIASTLIQATADAVAIDPTNTDAYSRTYTPDKDTIYSELLDDIARIADKSGNTSDLIVTMSIDTLKLLEKSTELSRGLNVDTFVNKTINTKIRYIDDTPIVPVVSKNMLTAYIYNDIRTAGQEQGGYKPAPGAKKINWIITRREAPIAVVKHVTPRIFTPDQNQRADGWVVNYRYYHDIWLPKNAQEGCYANIRG